MKNAAAAEEKITTQDNQIRLSIALYQSDFALIRDNRRIELNNGHNTLVWKEISATIKPETAWLRNLTHPEQFQIIAQRFDLDLLTPQKLLESHVGKTITVIRTHPVTGEEHREHATVLTTHGGTVLQFSDRIETGSPGRLAFTEIPSYLQEKPAMQVKVNNVANHQNHTTHDLELTYLTQGLSWRADYILVLDQLEQHGNLIGLATLTNQSGIDYHNATIELIAGKIHQASAARFPAAKRMNMALEAVSATQAEIQSEPHAELYRYHLPQVISLNNNQIQQVTFMSANAIPVTKQFILQGQSYYYSSYYHHPPEQQPVDVFFQFDNSKSNNEELGVPFPGGIVRAYQQDQLNNLHFIGEDRINHTANQSTVQLKLMQAFDITSEKRQTDFKKIPSPDQNIRQFESAHQIKLHNGKKETVTIIVREPIPGDWHMISESLLHNKITANLAEWHVEIPAESSTVLTYRVRTTL